MAYIYTPRSLSDIKELRMRIETEDPLYYGLKKLKIKGRDLSNIPPAVFHLQELEVLDLSPERESCLTFRLYFVPRAISKLVNLKVLVLDTNELDEVPIEITKLTNLERLALSNNQFSWLPEGFNKLTKLKSLHLANNEFEDFPMALCEMTNLEFLDLSDNKLSVLPDEISFLNQLHTLLLFYNRLDTLPESICDMTNLYCLWIGNNRIRRLPRDIGNLKNLDWGMQYTSSALDGNPLVSPPIEICRMGIEAIDRFLNRSKADLEQRSRNDRRTPQNSKDRNNHVDDRTDSPRTDSRESYQTQGGMMKTQQSYGKGNTQRKTRPRNERNGESQASSRMGSEGRNRAGRERYGRREQYFEEGDD